MERIARNINILGEFCGMRDVPELTPEVLRRAQGIGRADVMALFGGSILCGGDVLAEAMQRGIARKYVIVGGAGHTTEALRSRVRALFPEIETAGEPEARVFAAYLKKKYGLEADLLECASTNCGNNITYLLDLLRENGISFESIILTQDATMQRRMDAGLRKHAGAGLKIINFAAYSARVLAAEGGLRYEREIPGMWDVERYLSLLMGEIPRLSDDAGGYGPRGKGFIAHVDVPDAVRRAFEELRADYPGLVREARAEFASKD